MIPSFGSLFQVRRLVSDVSRHKLLILAGQCVEQSGDLVLQTGSFSLDDFIQIFADEEVTDTKLFFLSCYMYVWLCLTS